MTKHCTVAESTEQHAPAQHFLLMKREGISRSGELLSAFESAKALLDEAMWPLWAATKCRKKVRRGASVAIYLSGSRNQKVIAIAQIQEIAQWDRAMAKRYPLVLDGTPYSVLLLEHVVMLPIAVRVQERLQYLSFCKPGPKWGVAFMGGMRSLTASDYLTITQPQMR